MRMSHALLKTQKRVSAEAELPSHRLILQAGLARRVAAGIYSLTPLAVRVIHRIERVIREEMERIDGQEVLLPVAQPAELWIESGRYDNIGDDLARFRDRGGHAMVLAMTHEEAVTDLARAFIESYRQAPQMLFQIQTKFRDEPRPRGGLIRLREFLMKDAYSFHTTQADFDAYYERVVEAYRAIFRRLDLPVLVVYSDTGMMGGSGAHEFMLLADGGEDTLIVCPSCGYAANQEVATFDKSEPPRPPIRMSPTTPREVHTPGATTIAALCEALGCAPSHAQVRLLRRWRPRRGSRARPDPWRPRRQRHQAPQSAGTRRACPLARRGGGARPDRRLHRPGRPAPRRPHSPSSPTTPCSHAGDLVAGANRADYHLTGVRYGRDFTADLTGDLATARAGHRCAACGASLEERRGIEAANTFKLGTRYSASMGATWVDEAGASHPFIMGCYGLGITRALACLIEQHHDADGIIWPPSVAPYRYHLLTAGNDAAARAAADQLYAALGADDTLYDDRDLSAGVKFKDADLLGMPLRVTVSPRSLAAGGAELRLRATGETRIVPLDEVATAAQEYAV